MSGPVESGYAPMNNLSKHHGNQSGFSLVEVLITLVLTGLIMSAVYGVYISNIQQARVEDQRVDIQQSQRFAIDLLMNQLRHAGYDLTDSGTPTVVAAGTDYIYFTADLNDNTGSEEADGDVDDAGEHVVFCRYPDPNRPGFFQLGFTNGNGAGDADGDGIADIGDIDADGDGRADIGHNHGAVTHQPVLAIHDIEFFYTLSTGNPTIFPADPSTVRSVQISLLARSEDPDPQFNHPANATYTPAGASANPPDPASVVWTNIADNFRRRLMIANVRFRNMGL